jgi:hypothetical protein
MTQEAGASARTEWPRVLVYATALVCGLSLALAVHIGLSAAGIGLAGLTLDAIFSGKNQINTALSWWAIGIAGCLGSLAAIMVTRRFNRPGLRLLRRVLAIGFFCLLAAAGHKATAPAGSAAAATAINLAAMTLGGFMAFFAAHFAARR